MSTYVGGKRRRLIKDNLFNLLQSCLDDLDWFSTTRKHRPVEIVNSMVDNSVEIKPNTIGLSAEDLLNDPLELGSGLEDNIWSMFVDIFAENENVGLHLAGDIYDILRGKMSSIGRMDPSFEVMDLSLATPVAIFTCQIENIEFARNRDWAKPFNKFWWTVAFDIVDSYDDESDD